MSYLCVSCWHFTHSQCCMVNSLVVQCIVGILHQAGPSMYGRVRIVHWTDLTLSMPADPSLSFLICKMGKVVIVEDCLKIK